MCMKKVIACFTCAVALAACVDGFKDEAKWVSSTRNMTLASPAKEQIIVRFSADGATQTIEWPVVPGAGGYLVSVFRDTAGSWVPVGEVDETVDKPSVMRYATEDTYYKVAVKTLGNANANNKDAPTATEKEYNNLLSVYAKIPDYEDLKDYFEENPIPADSAILCYELEAGGTYFMSASVELPTFVVIRGENKDNRASLSLSEGSFVNNGFGFRLQNVDVTIEATHSGNGAFILMSSTFDAGRAAQLSAASNPYIVVPTSSPIAIQSCNITGLKQSLFYDSNQRYAIGSFLIKDCVIERSTGVSSAELRFQAGAWKDITLTGSTFYATSATASSPFFIQNSATTRVVNILPTMETWSNGSITITNCTFFQVCKNGQSLNSNGVMRTSGDKVIALKNLFVDSFEGEAARRLNQYTAVFEGGFNSYWFNNAFPTGEVRDGNGNTSGRDNTGTYIDIDPELTYTGDGQFEVSSPIHKANGIGDLRWYK